MNLVAIPALTDNYIWMLHNDREALLVDPGEAAPVTGALDAQGLTLAGILVTHRRADHVGGVVRQPRLRGPVHGPKRNDTRQPYVPLAEHGSCTALALRCEAQREKRLPTLPGSIARERAVNPFLRYPEPGVVQSALQRGAASSDGEVSAALRPWKNQS